MNKKTIILSFVALLMATVAMAQQGSKEVNKRATVVSKPYPAHTAAVTKPTEQTTTAKVETKPVVRSAEYNKRAEERVSHGRKESWGNKKAPFKK